LLNETVSAFEPEAQARGVEVRTNVLSEIPIVDLDAVRIREVVMNLLANAVRHSPKSRVVEVELEATTADIAVRVADRGPGIPAAALPHIFDRFYKGEGSTGSGLGLTIARNLIAAHGGTIAARARAGGGTSVEFKLPRLATSD
jgi:signal transduction histidine kinase